MKILAFAASNSRNSINRSLIDYASSRLKSDILPAAELEFLDLNDYEMPIYGIDREQEEGIPEKAQAFFDKIGAADAVLVAFAEHNGSSTAAWKNTFDWMSRIEMKLWRDTPVVMLAATPGGRAGAGVLGQQKDMAPRFGANLLGTLGIGRWGQAYDADKKVLVNADDVAALDAVLAKLATVSN